MAKQIPPDSQPKHAAIRRLLSRYAELKYTGRDADAMYPDIAEHLQRCIDCRALLADTVQASSEPAGWLSASELPFLQTHGEEPDIRVTPGSSPEAFRMHISLSLPHTLAQADMRSPGAAEPGERLLLARMVPLGDEEVGVTLVVARNAAQGIDTNEVTVTGEIYGDALPPVINAQLAVGSRLYHSSAQDSMLRFKNVVLPDEGELINLMLDTST